MKKWQVNKCKYLSSEKYEIDTESPYDFKQLHSNVFFITKEYHFVFLHIFMKKCKFRNKERENLFLGTRLRFM